MDRQFPQLLPEMRRVGPIAAATLTAVCLLVIAAQAPATPALPPPENVAAWYSGSYVQVVWDRSGDPDIVGYAVYRSVDGGAWEKLTATPFDFGVFVDYSPPTGSVRYWVKSVGRDGAESAEGYVATVQVTPVPLRRPTATFNQDDIITDQQLLDRSKFTTVDSIQSFLVAQGSVLATYATLDWHQGGASRTAAQIIYDACAAANVNPEIVLTTLQKEKGLIRSASANPDNLAMGWNETVDSTKGFVAQVYRGAMQFRLYYDRLTGQPGYYDWSIGTPHAVQDGTITPDNNATIGLYLYTPWIGQGGGGAPGVGGNYLFWDLWYQTFQFGGGEPVPAKPVTIGPGSIDSTATPTLDTLTPTLTWSAVANADIYQVYVSRAPYGPDNIVYADESVAGSATSVDVPASALQFGTSYRWNMRASNASGTSEYSDRRYFRTAPSAIDVEQVGGYVLGQNYPNPFNKVTNIQFTLPNPADVRITIYNANGQPVTTLVDGHFAAGTHLVSWNADSAGSGLYFYRLVSGTFSETRRLILTR